MGLTRVDRRTGVEGGSAWTSCIFFLPPRFEYCLIEAMNPSISAILLVAILSACASQRPELIDYDVSSGRTVYTSPKLLAGNLNMTGGLTSGHRVMMQAFASCEGRTCRPNEIELAFLNDSSADLNLDYRRVKIVFAGRSVEWEDEGRITEPTYYSVPRGEFIRVPISRGDFELMANAPLMEVTFGQTGTTVIDVPFSRRAPLRELVEAIAGQES